MFADVENVPTEKYVTEAGKNLTIPCPGVNEQSLVNTLVWKTSNTIVARYTNGKGSTQNPRVSIGGVGDEEGFCLGLMVEKESIKE